MIKILKELMLFGKYLLYSLIGFISIVVLLIIATILIRWNLSILYKLYNLPISNSDIREVLLSIVILTGILYIIDDRE